MILINILPMTISGFWGFATVVVIAAAFVYHTYMKYKNGNQ